MLKIGVSRGKITPRTAKDMSGFVARKGHSIGVHDDLWATAAVLQHGMDRVALVSLDLIGVESEMVEAIKKVILDISGDAIPLLVSATHTHSGPAVLKKSFLGKVDDSFWDEVVNTTARVVQEANLDLQIATPYFSFAFSPLCKNRRKTEGVVDSSVQTIRFDRVGQGPVFMVNYSCHPVVLGPDNLLFSGDYPHFLRSYLERAWPGCSVLFFNGATGDVNTGHSAQDSIKANMTSQRTFQEAELIGNILAQAVIDAQKQSFSVEPTLTGLFSQKVKLQYDCLPSKEEFRSLVRKLEDELAEVEMQDHVRVDAQILGVKLRWAKHWIDRIERLETNSLETTMHGFGLGSCRFITFPGEAFCELGLSLKASQPGKQVFILGYTNDSIGYIFTPEAYLEGGYEVDESYLYYGLPNKFEQYSGEKMVRAGLALLNRIESASVFKEE